jgi:transposase InsO family protein
MKRKFKSGLYGREIIGIFITQSEVEKVAKMALIKAVAITKF